MSRNLKISLSLVVAAVVVVVVVANLTTGNATATPASSRMERLVRADSRRLGSESDGSVTFVEFLDFECEACAAAHPAVEELRRIFDGRVTFVVRNFPLHRNSEAAARAAEAAAEQGKFEEMYDLLFETQAYWGEQSTPQDEEFFRFASDLDLDMDRFRTVFDDPATLEKVRRDKADGIELGVSATPTFFLNGDKLEVSSFEELVDLIDAAVAA